ncbi:ATPase [Halobacteriales archaeon QS_8_69_73]|nr:MAG: ATPase [Halobacteriales archaeon QS_8_69_73]
MEALDVGGRARQFGRSDVQWKRVVSVESLDETRRVYDLDVELNDNFVADGVFVHNSNSASVICEKLLDQGYGLLVVDIDGEYYGLKEEYEILHVGADEECDLRVSVEYAEKIAELALEQNVPIILDVSSFLDESEARELLTAVAKQLFAREKKLKQPFLMLIEEVHEFIPEGGGLDECGRMLIKVGKRGRKHGLGVVGISQRPADVKKDFITQCDWMVWHRLTWNNDTKVVGRILGGDYADHIEEMDDGECFLQTDYNDDVQVVQFERKRTFDAGATPGLEDFERPELKSVSGDLLGELEEIVEVQEQREDRIAELERELERKDERIRDLEQQLSEAQDLKRMADRFSRAMMDQVTGRPLSAASVAGTQAELDDPSAVRRDPELQADLEAVRDGEREPTPSPVPDAAEERAGGAERSELTDDEPTSGPVDGLIEQVAETRAAELGATRGDDPPGRSEPPAPDTDPNAPSEGSSVFRPDESLAGRLRREIGELSDTEREMLRRYRGDGPATPQEAHAAAGGSGDRTDAYAANRSLRRLGLVDHVARGRHGYALPELIAEETDDRLGDASDHDRLVRAVEATFLEHVDPPGDAADGGGTGDAAGDVDTGEADLNVVFDDWPGA